MARWITCYVLSAAAVACLPDVNAAFLPVVLCALPLMTEVLRAMRDNILSLPLSGIAMGWCYTLLPEGALRVIGMAFSMLPAAVTIFSETNDGKRHGAVWCGMYAAGCIAVLLALGARYDGRAADGLTQRAVDALLARPDARHWMYTLARTGLLQLKATKAEIAAILVTGEFAMTPSIMAQLGSTLQRMLSEALTAFVPGAMVLLCGWMGTLCAVIPDRIRSKRVGWRDLPPMKRWYMDRAWTPGLLLLLAPTVLVWLGGGAWLVTMARLCMGAFQLAMSIQGVCLLLYLREEKSELIPSAVMLLLVVVMPAVLVWAGILDQMADFRGLRPAPEDPFDDM